MPAVIIHIGILVFNLALLPYPFLGIKTHGSKLRGKVKWNA